MNKSNGTELRIILDGDGALSDWMADRPKVRHINQGLRVLRLTNGTSGGNNAVSVCARSPSGQVIVLEMTERLFLLAAHAIYTRSKAEGTLAPDIIESGGDIRLSDDALAHMTPEQLRQLQAVLDAQLDQVIARQRGAR